GFPAQGVGADPFEIVMDWLLAEHSLEQGGVGDDGSRIARAWRTVVNLEIASRYAPDRVDHLADGIAVPVAAIGDERALPLPQMLKRQAVRGDQIADMDVVAYACPVRGRVSGSVDGHAGALAERGF